MDPDTSGATILVVDDSATYRAALTLALEGASYRVLTAATGEEALRIAARTRPAAVIVDLLLPGLDGAGVVRNIRLDGTLHYTPCMVLTSSEDPRDELRCLEAGADAYVRKPEGMEFILARLEALLRACAEGGDEIGTPSLLGPKRVLLVDDMPRQIADLADQLKAEGYAVTIARSGEEALAQIEANAFDAVLLDIMMPGLSGLDVCQIVKSHPGTRHIPVLVYSVLDQREDKINALKAGADEFFVKGQDYEVIKRSLLAHIRRRHYEEERRRMREESLRRAAAERENEFKSRALANMAHDLRTPLTAILGFSDALLEGDLDHLNDRQRGAVSRIQDAGQHLLGLVNDILDISKLAAGRLELDVQVIDPGEQVQTVLQGIRPLADEKGIALEAEFETDLPPIRGDALRVKQILYNLLSNAIKFTGTGGRVQVHVSRKGQVVAFAVTDNGIGIRKEDFPRLFREFEQIVPPGGEKPKGTGLGLAISRRLVELHGGRLEVESEEAKGSTFRFGIPVAPVPNSRYTSPKALPGNQLAGP